MSLQVIEILYQTKKETQKIDTTNELRHAYGMRWQGSGGVLSV